MHIAEGALSGSPEGIVVLSAGWLVTAVGTAIGLRTMDYERIPQVGMLSAAFFVVSLIAVPNLGPTSVHLVLCGLMGLVLGWRAFPAILVALFLQAMLFGAGGLTTLGINTVTMAVPAVVCHYLFGPAIRGSREGLTFLAGFGAGVVGYATGALINAGAMFLSGEEFQLVSATALIGHSFVVPIEGLVTGSVVVFLRKVRPELLAAPLLLPRRREATDA